jgi:hypothetical protein
MANPVTDREKQLALRAHRLWAGGERPIIVGGGLFGDLLNFLTTKVPVWVIRSALLVFIAYHAWLYDAKARQKLAETATANREAVRQETEAQAVRRQLGLGTVAMATVLAELEKIEADKAKATAEVEALGHVEDNATARLRVLQAEIAKAEAERSKAQAELDAQQRLVGNVPILIRQKRAELEKLQADIQTQISVLRVMVGSQLRR